MPTTNEPQQPSWDAETLMSAEEIRGDKKRYTAAIKAAKTIITERAQQLKVAKKIGKRTVPIRGRKSAK